MVTTPPPSPRTARNTSYNTHEGYLSLVFSFGAMRVDSASICATTPSLSTRNFCILKLNNSGPYVYRWSDGYFPIPCSSRLILQNLASAHVCFRSFALPATSGVINQSGPYTYRRSDRYFPIPCSSIDFTEFGHTSRLFFFVRASSDVRGYI